jgi:hypothetical protein
VSKVLDLWQALLLRPVTAARDPQVVAWVTLTYFGIEPRAGGVLRHLRIGAVPSGVPAEETGGGLAVNHRLREGQQRLRCAGRQECVRQAPITEYEKVCDLVSVAGLQSLARDQSALNGRENHYPVRLGQLGQSLGMRDDDRVGGCLSQQEAVLPDLRVLLRGGAPFPVFAAETDHGQRYGRMEYWDQRRNGRCCDGCQARAANCRPTQDFIGQGRAENSRQARTQGHAAATAGAQFAARGAPPRRGILGV